MLTTVKIRGGTHRVQWIMTSLAHHTFGPPAGQSSFSRSKSGERKSNETNTSANRLREKARFIGASQGSRV